LGESQFEASLKKNTLNTPFQLIKVGHHTYMGSISRRNIVQTGPGINARPYLKNT
jgi:hypothetical protein